MTTNRFAIDLTEVSEERVLVPAGLYPTRIVKAEFKDGEKDGSHWGALNFTLNIRDEEVQKLLNQDEPKLFYNLFLSFDKETEAFLPKNNADFGVLLKVCDLKGNSEHFMEGTEEAEAQWEFNKIFFKNVADTLVGYDILANVIHRTNRQDKDKIDAIVNKVGKLEE